MSLMVEKDVKEVIYYSIYRCLKANNKHMSGYDKRIAIS